MIIKINTNNYYLRELTIEDASEKYLNWLNERQAERWLVTAKNTKVLTDLEDYISKKNSKSEVCLLGIFEKNNGEHIGNIKYEPINENLGYAVMGILIGDPLYRGKGVFGEIFKASANWLRKYHKIKQIVLGVENDNVSAIRAYTKIGFIEYTTPFIKCTSSTVVTMVFNI